MALKTIVRAGEFGAYFRKIVHATVSLANREAAASAAFARFMLFGREPVSDEAPPAAPALSGGVCPDTAEVRQALAVIVAAVPVPTDAEIDAASGGLLDAADRVHVKSAVRRIGAWRYVADRLAAGLPANDV